MIKTLDDHVREMRALSTQLIPYSYPNAKFEDEYLIIPLKFRTFRVDGFEVSVNFSMSEFKEFMMESVNIESSYAPFLPFSVVCKIGVAFLGKKNLSYLGIVKNNKKIYCWSVKKVNGSVVKINKKFSSSSYDGLDFSIMNYKNS